TTASRSMPLVVRSDPMPDESPAGLLLHLAEANGLRSPLKVCLPHFEQRLPLEALFSATYSPDLAAVLGIDPEVVQKFFYQVERTGNISRIRMPSGHELHGWLLNWTNPKICRPCLRRGSILKAEWDLTFQIACVEHGVLLSSECNGCGHPLTWIR